MRQIARDAAEDPQKLKDAPHSRPVRRVDEVRAVKQPVLRYQFDRHPEPHAAGPQPLEAPKGA